MRCRPAVKSVVPAGRYSSCTILACLEDLLEGLDAVAAEGVVVRQRGDHCRRPCRAPRRWRRRPGELLRPVRKMYLFHLSPVIESATAGSTSRIFLYSSATGSMASATDDGRADRDVDLVVAVGRGQQALAHVGLALVVLLDHHQLLAGHHHRAAGGVVQAHVEADDGLLGIGLQRAGLAGDEGDLDFALVLRQRGAAAATAWRRPAWRPPARRGA